MNTSSWSIVCDSGDTRPAATASRHVHSPAEPRLGAAIPVNSMPGSSKRGASA
jgi:hypothetical protein